MSQADAPPHAFGSEPQSRDGAQNADDWSGAGRRWRYALIMVFALLAAQRLAYHLNYLIGDPFAWATFSDGQLYEEAARDILAHPPLGSRPFYLQGLYAYLLALPMAVSPRVVMGLLLQLVLATLALWAFYDAAVRTWGKRIGALSCLVLLAYHGVAFYENKYLSVALGVICDIAALWAFIRAARSGRASDWIWAGAGSGLECLGRPNLAVALPFALVALFKATRARHARIAPALAAFAAGLVLALAPMAARNLMVTGRPDVFPSHGGGIAFYIGNNPHANGRWNTAGGLVSGQVALERAELKEKLGIRTGDAAGADDAMERELYRRGWEFIRSEPDKWLDLELKKLWMMIGNHEYVRDYDLLGEKELLGSIYFWGLPFGIVLGLGAIGLAAAATARRGAAGERAVADAALWVSFGQLAAVVAANLLWFTSAQNRAPLALPLAFFAGPALDALWVRARGGASRASTLGLLAGLLLAAQAFWPREQVTRPSSFHYYNLGAVQETLGRYPDAIASYRRALERNPEQPMFALRLARRLRLTGRSAEARDIIDRLLARPGLPSKIRIAALRERQELH